MLKYKCEELGIRVIEVDEKYTSKACSLNDDIAKLRRARNPNFTGKRIQRGLYETRNPWTGGKVLINADCNAAANMLKLVGVDLAKVLAPRILIWKLASPVRVRELERLGGMLGGWSSPVPLFGGWVSPVWAR